jgi:hypothetical protein
MSKNAPKKDFTQSKGKVYEYTVFREKEFGRLREVYGIVYTKNGIVKFYQSIVQKTDGTFKRYLRMVFVRDGIEYIRKWESYFGQKTITFLGKSFAKAVVNGECDD